MRGSAAFRAGVAPGGALAGPWVRNPLWRNARAVPSLDLQLADNKSLVDGVTGKNLVDFTRASSATFTGSDGLIKSAVTNLLLRSEELATSPWFNANVTLTNNSTDVLDPIGGNKSTKIVSTGIASAVGQGATISAASTASIWLRTSSGTASFSLAIYLSSSPFTNIGTANITVTTSWQRFSVTSSTPPSGASYNFQLQVIPVSTTLYAWGAQLEQSSTVGEYIPTTSTINSDPRFDHNPTTGESLGLLVEEARTNSIVNSNSMTAVVTGSPGTLPTGWNAQGNTNGWTREVVGSGSIGALNYVDIRFSGTPTNSLFSTTFQAQGVAAASNGQSWAASVYHQLVGGSLSNIIGYPAANLWNSSSAYLSGLTLPGSLIPKSSLQRYSGSGTISQVNTAFISWGITFVCTIGNTYDFTIRVAGPQLELGAFSTSYIPTTSATATRAADVASVTGTNFSSWYNQGTGSVFISSSLLASVNTYEASFTDNTNNNHHYLRYLATQHQLVSAAGGIANTSIYSTGGASQLLAKTAYAYGSTEYSISSNGLLGTLSSTTGTIPATINSLNIGSSQVSSATGNLTIKRLTYWPVRLGNNVLQQITQ